LRQKLAVYYQTEANGDTVLVSVPKGAYKLNFDHQAAERPEAIPDEPRQWTKPLAVALAIMTLWAVVSTAFYVRARRQLEPLVESWSPELESLWQPFLQSNR